MTDHCRQRTLSLEDWEDSRVDRHLAPGIHQALSSGLSISSISQSNGSPEACNPHSYPFDHLYQALVLGKLRFCDDLLVGLVGFQVDAFFIDSVRCQGPTTFPEQPTSIRLVINPMISLFHIFCFSLKR